MEIITTTSGLRHAIQELEIAQLDKEQLLKEELYDILEGLKPINLLKSTLSNFSSSPALSTNLIGPIAGLATGYLSQKLIVGASGNIFRNIIGTLVQFGVTNFVTRKYEKVKTLSGNIFQRLFRKNKEISEEPDQSDIDKN